MNGEEPRFHQPATNLVEQGRAYYQQPQPIDAPKVEGRLH